MSVPHQKLFSYGCKFAFVLVLTALLSANVNAINPTHVSHKIILTHNTPLAAFEGLYQAKDNAFSVFKITVAGDKLLAKALEGEQQFTLTRKSDLSFESPDEDGDETMVVVFSKTESGEISGAVVSGHQWNKIKSYTPPAEIQLTAEQLKSFEGKYEFETKKGTYLQITATANGLLLKQLWDGREINFTAIGEQSFLNRQMGFPLVFTKDANGTVIKVLAFGRDSWDKVKE
ncbi:MAG: hypothetical protein ACHQF4_00975 [Sphingobacteriales bacterium]